MFNSTVLEVAIGMIFCYASVALIVSSINEALASMLQWRAKSLLDGIQSLLNDPQFTGLARGLYNHALIDPIDPGEATTVHDLKHPPAYIDAQHFAMALIDTIRSEQGDFVALGNDLKTIPNLQLRQALQGMYARAAGDAERFEAAVGQWFDSSMERLSGAYKRRAQLSCFLIGIAVAGLFNIDSFHLFGTLWQHPGLAAQLSAPGDRGDVSHLIDDLKALPIGWDHHPAAWDTWLIAVGGWLVTATSALFGAPFWFDLLKSLTQLRRTDKQS